MPRTLDGFNLLLTNFLEPLAFRIWNYMHLSWIWQLLTKIGPQDREKSLFSWNSFRKIRLALFTRFALVLFYKVLLFEGRKILRLYKPYSITLGGERTFPGAWAPGRATKIALHLHSDHFFQILIHLRHQWRADREISNSSKNVDWANKTRARALMARTLVPFNLLLTNFLEPLAFRIWNYMRFSWIWQLLTKILRQDREKSLFLWNNFWKIRLAFLAPLPLISF